jgi:hypothetical protein
MEKLLLLFYFSYIVGTSHAQYSADTLKPASAKANADDPSQYTKVFPKKKMLFALVLQQANAESGDKARSNVSFSKAQAMLIKIWTPRLWTTLAPEWFIDYVHGSVSMNLRSRVAYAPVPRINIWITPSAGIFGDFAGRYKWSLDIGGRNFFMRKMDFTKKKSGL